MNKTGVIVFASLLSGFAAAGASADVVFGQPVRAPELSSAVIEFTGSSASSPMLLIHDDGSSNSWGGSPIFNSHFADAGETYFIPVLEADAPIMLGFKRLQTGETFWLGNNADAGQFSYETLSDGSFRVGIEETRLPGGDADFDDMIVTIRFAPSIPAPGALALTGLAGLVALKRRRG